MISIITINKNNAEGLKQTIKSVIDQTYRLVDFIVVDGDSTDGSKQVVDEFKGQLAVALSEPDTGIYNAMNKGIRMAKGDYLLFLNSGDKLLNNDVLTNIAPLLNTADIISGNIVIEDEKGITHRCLSQDEISWRYFSAMSLYHQATFISKKTFDTYGLYDERFKLGGDYEFFIRIFFKYNASYKHIPEFVSYFKSDGISNNSAYAELNKKEAQLAREYNLSKQVLTVFAEQLEFERSNMHWLYLKSRSSALYRRTFAFLYALRYHINRLIKK